MKTILIADWLQIALVDVLNQAARAGQFDHQYLAATSLETAQELLPDVRPALVICQPSLLMENDQRLLSALKQQDPPPKLLVWWGNRPAYHDFIEYHTYPQTVTYIEIPASPMDMVRLVDKLLSPPEVKP
jgi:hypothetical protein